MQQAAIPAEPVRVSSTDWLKLVGIAAFILDHIGFFFIEDADWFRIAGRVAAPIFFFFIGFARSRAVPLSWIVLGVGLSALDSWLDDFDSVTVNILLNFALARLMLRAVDRFAGSPLRLAAVAAFAIVLVPWTAEFIEYGTEGWLWTLFGFAQRRWRDGDAAFAGARFAFASLAAGVYAYVEIGYHELSGDEGIALIACILVLAGFLLSFQRRPSAVQPPAFFSAPVRFVSRYSLEIYALSLVAMQVVADVIE